MIRQTLLGLCLAAATAVTAAETFKLDSEKEWKLPRTGGKFENGTFQILKPIVLYSSKKLFPVEEGKSYKISGKFRKISGSSVESRLYFGFIPYDANGRLILSAAVNPIAGTETELAAAVNSGDRILKVKNASKWKKGKLVVFNAKPDFSDLPNRSFTSAVQTIAAKDGVWEVELQKPLHIGYPAGTPIRQHSHGFTYIYAAASNSLIPAEWQEISGTVSGISAKGLPKNQWWKGTAKVAIILFSPVGKPAEFEFKDVQLTVE